MQVLQLAAARCCSQPQLGSVHAGTMSYVLLLLRLQANVWTEYIPDEATVEYMLLPRMTAMAEVLWSPVSARDWDGFLARLPRLLRHYDAAGLRYRPPG